MSHIPRVLLTFLAWLALGPLLTACTSEPANRFEFTRLCMGVQTKIVTWAPDHETASEAAAAAFSEIGRLDAIMSDYQKASELNRLSESAGGPPVRVSKDLFRVIELSLRMSRESNGAFDITVGPVVRLWRAARREGRLPPPDQLAAARELIGYRTIVLNPADRTIRLARAGTRLDLGGIAKGYAAQRGLEIMRKLGRPRSLVALAGDITAGEPPPGETGWRIALQGEQSGQSYGVLLLSNAAVSTSGDTEQFIEIEGQRYSHIIDPGTGIGMTARRAVSVVTPSAELTDPLATAACILGPDATRSLLANYPGSAAVFEEPARSGVRRIVIDPDHVLRWKADDEPVRNR